MLLALLVINIIATVVADPFHKYPYVFLLDVGNEEIEGTNAEQLRVTIPGGSLALKYPAVDTGDTISHVRVSGIDFGTDLKAEIVEGGPGYKYVVLVFMGNPGVAYDAVVTIETVNKQSVDTSISVEEANDSAEDTSDYDTKDETVVAPSNLNAFNVNDISNNDYRAAADNLNEGDEQVDDENEENEENEYPDVSDKQKYLDQQRYGKYQSFRPQLYGGARIYPQASLYVEDSNFKPLYDPENHVADDNNGNIIYLDSNNNVNLEYNSVSADY